MPQTINKIVRIGLGSNGNIYCKITFNDGKLSIIGVEGPKPDGDAIGSCGQIIMSEWNIREYADGWNPEHTAKFRDVWDRWHLNDMTAGSPDQDAWVRANKLDTTYPKSHYAVYRDALTEVGLNPDPNYPHNGKPYKYGTAWIFTPVPDDVIEFLASLPDTDKTPAWI